MEQAAAYPLRELEQDKADQRNRHQRRKRSAHVAITVSADHESAQAAAAGDHFDDHRDQHGDNDGDLDAIIDRGQRQRQDDSPEHAPPAGAARLRRPEIDRADAARPVIAEQTSGKRQSVKISITLDR